MDDTKTKERPLECTGCSKKLAFKYSEVKDVIVNSFYMCKDCPKLRDYLFVEKPRDHSQSSGLACGHCSTNLTDVQRGDPLGCPDCYDTFESFIYKDLNYFCSSEEEQVEHLGQKPGELKEINPSLKILALNEALAKTLNEENYEQAAWIRDQIKELKKKAKEK